MLEMTYDTLTISGCSIYAIGILGALQYAYDNNHLSEVQNYVGTSAGAIIGYLLAIGYKPIEVIPLLCTSDNMSKLKINVSGFLQCKGASKYEHIEELIELLTIDKLGVVDFSLQDLYKRTNKKLYMTTYNMTKQQLEVLSPDTTPDLDCITALRMTSNIPMVFGRYKHGDSYYVDGGVLNNFPIDVASEYGTNILAILSDWKIENSDYEKLGLVDYLIEIMSIPILKITSQIIEKYKDKCKIIRIKPADTRFFNFTINTKQKLNMFSDGYEQIKTQY